ncbi:MAG TPA: ZIP family metal transporter [Candidatus Limnocylindria bacterium]|nr:ZIP family metal transporter [Candidatus Limnocylindria bacterium]
MTVFAVVTATFLSTLGGGLVALRSTRQLGFIIALGAGVRIGAAFFDLAPESASEIGSINDAMLFAGIGFLAFYLLERITLLHVGHEAGHPVERHEHVGALGAGGMSVHSFLDGIAVGASFHASAELGIIVATVVILHDFSDGIATVSVLLANEATRAVAFRWLLLDAAAPVIGATVALFLTIEGPVLGAILGLFVGFFLYVGAAELLPEAHRKGRGDLVMLGTVAGAAFIFAVTKLVSGP